MRPSVADQAFAPPSRLRYYKHNHPLATVMMVAAVLRLLAAFFSKGYAFFDDHFCVIEQAQDWIYGFNHDLNKHDPPLHPVLYSGLHYYLFKFLETAGIYSADLKMLINRMLHGGFSLLTVYYGYKLTEKISDTKNAFRVGMLLATLWFMPFLATKDLVEMVCIPFCLAGFNYLLNAHNATGKPHKQWVLAGILFGIAFTFRMHTILFAGGAGLVMLYRKQWLGSFLFAISYGVFAFGIQGLIDAYFFEYPLHSIVAYFNYNSTHAYAYVTSPFYQFVFTIVGFLVPPISLFLIFGFFKARKIEPMIFTAALLFFLLHSYFPNKQERFILPLFPLLIILGTVGWYQYSTNSPFWQRHTAWIRYSWRFFWTLQLSACVLLIFTYSKKSKIEPLVYLSTKSPQAIIIDHYEGTSPMTPVFYLGFASTHSYFLERRDEMTKLKESRRLDPDTCIIVFESNKGKEIQVLKQEIDEMKKQPEYVIFSGSEDYLPRVERLKQLYPQLKLEKEIEPALYDEILHFLNPRIHKDQTTVIYSTQVSL